MSESTNSSNCLDSIDFLDKIYLILNLLLGFPWCISQSGKYDDTEKLGALMSITCVKTFLTLVQKCLLASGLFGFNENRAPFHLLLKSRDSVSNF